MSFNLTRILVLLTLTFLSCSPNKAKHSNKTIEDFNKLSEQFLNAVRLEKNTTKYQELLANTSLEALKEGLPTDAQKLAFWINIYNAYIQVILKKNPNLYENRNSFFNDNRILIAGESISFALIEHGIIRKSQWAYGLGKIKKWFPSTFETTLRVNQRNYQIHFALNCGAKDCPPVTIYTPEDIDEQLSNSTALFLKNNTRFDNKTNEVVVTPLFSWFRGDFGSEKGIKKILKNQQLIPSTKNIEIRYSDYDWTLDLNNWLKP